MQTLRPRVLGAGCAGPGNVLRLNYSKYVTHTQNLMSLISWQLAHICGPHTLASPTHTTHDAYHHALGSGLKDSEYGNVIKSNGGVALSLATLSLGLL